MESSSELPPSADTEPTTPTNPSTVSSSELRFPTPAADTRVTNWVESIAASNMSARSEDGSTLGDSAYEFIDTDTESRDDNATESIASTDFGRPEDDVASLADTERSGEESGDDDEDNSEGAPIPTFPGLDGASSAFETPTIGRNSAVLLEEHDKPLTQSIEFEEPFSLGAENVSVKHTVADFHEEQTARIVTAMKLPSPPQRLVVTIRQTMTKQGLSTRDPLRILYVGSHSAKQDIIHKLASSVTASVEGGKHLRHSASQLYNVVPVSAFGSERTPEIELMHSSGYQIKVEDCTYATTLKFEDDPQKPDVIKLTLDDNFSYHSVPEEPGFIVEPHWELPHIAVFYCSDSDDAEAKRTRSITRKFMGRHSIPSIVISHKQLFDRAQCMSLDQHSIHMCLESRDSNGRGTIIHQRLPIDLASFLNIDARQMNRNLAYLTGLHEPLEEKAPVVPAPTKVEVDFVNPPDVEKTSYSISDSVSFIRNRNGAEWRALLPVGLLLISVFTAVLTGIPSYRFASKPAISINSKVMSTIPISSTSSANQLSVVPSITSSTRTISTTSTRTITVTHAQSSGPNSLSVVPSMEIGKTSQTFQNQPKTGNKSVCSAEILGEREILIRIPSTTKLSWLTKEAMSVNITRGDEAVDTERVYSSDDGIVLLLSKNDAYGVLNISVITTRKPRVNETFQVDFGTPASQAWQSLVDKVSSLFPEDLLTDPLSFGKVRSAMEDMAEEARTQSQATLKQMEEVRRLAMEQASSATEGVTDIAKRMSLEAAKRSAIISKEIGIQISDMEKRISKQMEGLNKLGEPLNDGILKAQVQSKLMWLKMQGKEEEYKRYEKAATEAMRQGSKKTKFCKRAEEKQKQKDKRAAKKAAKKEARAGKKAGRKPT